MLSLAIISWGANAQHDHSTMGHSDNDNGKMDSKMTTNSSVQTSITVEHSKTITAILENYLKLKNELVEDNSKKASIEGNNLFDAFTKFDLSTQPELQIGINWMWSYFTYDKGDRVIIRSVREENRKEGQKIFMN